MTNEEHNKEYSWEEMSKTPGVYSSVRFGHEDISLVCVGHRQILFISEDYVETADDSWQRETFKKSNKKITIQFENE